MTDGKLVLPANEKGNVLVVRKPDRTISVVPLTNEASLRAMSNRLKPGEQWTFEKMSAEKAAKLPPIDPHYVSASEAKAELADAKAEIEALRAQLASKGGSADGAANLHTNIHNISNKSAENQSQQQNDADKGNGKQKTLAVDQIAKIHAAETVEAVEVILGDDDRSTVIQAANDRVLELRK